MFSGRTRKKGDSRWGRRIQEIVQTFINLNNLNGSWPNEQPQFLTRNFSKGRASKSPTVSMQPNLHARWLVRSHASVEKRTQGKDCALPLIKRGDSPP